MTTTVPAPLAGKIAIVTGGSKGIGAGIAITFAKQGCTHIAITYKSDPAGAEETCKAMTAVSPSIKTFSVAASVEDTEFGTKVVQGALEGLGVDHIDIAVSSAAIVNVESFPSVADMTFESWNKVITGEAWAPFTLARAAVEIGKMPHGGRIIMLSSASSKIANGDPLTSYSVGKAAMEAVVRNMSAVYGIQKGITVNSISVGATLTATMQSFVDKSGPEFEAYVKGFSVLKRLGEVQEVADIVAFVASPQASWIVGNSVPANGGSLLAVQG
ncbi:NAD(P)-binding protein [Polychaeton citri CBS 116435]|uniref:NAD(P)-binding protein n=1 Tax=Polychaeton citri CBS 116435 TaxID=1314669 RepID=A0A9P4UM63_9PEZI|nr:NAD(P)-binding protein [Polychaeton citri CBS 116435]